MSEPPDCRGDMFSVDRRQAAVDRRRQQAEVSRRKSAGSRRRRQWPPAPWLQWLEAVKLIDKLPEFAYYRQLFGR